MSEGEFQEVRAPAFQPLLGTCCALDLEDHETPQMYNESPFVCELRPVTFYFLQPQDLIHAGWKPS